VVPAAQARRTGTSAKQPHCVLEFTAGTPLDDDVVARSTRLILRFGDEPVEADEEYARLTPQLPGVRAGLISGLNGPADGDRTGARWLADLAGAWHGAGLPVVHHELAEFPSPERLRRALTTCVATSVGLSLSELRTLAGGRVDVVRAAVQIGEQARVQRVIVHADDWSVAVHRDEPEHERKVLTAGNLLAAARARAGRPTGALRPDQHAVFTEELPPTGPLGDGWFATAVPAPYLPRPAATIGLGDTFVAGVLLAESLV
jgi:ADP-dependent phosphofructokinase/glucokinase